MWHQSLCFSNGQSSSQNVCLDCIDWLDEEKSFFIIKLETWNIPSCILSKQRNDCLMFANFQHLLQVIWEENNPAEIFENSAGIWKVISIFSNNSFKNLWRFNSLMSRYVCRNKPWMRPAVQLQMELLHCMLGCNEWISD